MNDLSGEWDGHFDYPAGFGPSTPFLATIKQAGGRISGSIMEPDLYSGTAPAKSVIEGIAAGQAVDFTKTYHQVSFGYRDPVDYVGQVSENGDRITGVWSLLDMNGSFEMTRQSGHKEAAEREAEVALKR